MDLTSRNLTHSSPSRRVLIIEDSEFVHQIYRVAFRKLPDWEPEHVHNGQEGLAAFERRKPDLIIVDINMPVMDGLRFLDELRVRHSHQKASVHILVASTEGRDDQIKDALRRGASSFLKKPFTLDELMTLLGRISATLPPAPNRGV